MLNNSRDWETFKLIGQLNSIHSGGFLEQLKKENKTKFKRTRSICKETKYILLIPNVPALYHFVE